MAITSSLEDRLLAITRALQKGQIPHAFGGAIALAFYSEPRATADLDINIFLHPEQKTESLFILSKTIGVDDPGTVAQTIDLTGQARMRWGETPIDLFFSNTPFHDSCAARIRWVNYLREKIPILSAEDLVVFKLSYDRPQDWFDVGKMLTFGEMNIDEDYIRNWLAIIFDRGDRRIARLQVLLARGQK